MLQKLLIKNYAIIDLLSLEPDTHLNTVTGETGAGKSIILGALSLILGDRADTSVLINKEEKSVIEAHFDVSHNESFRVAMEAAGFDYEPHCIIRREIAASGKSRAFINDTPATLNALNDLTSLLVDLHQQFGHLALQDDHFSADVLDALAQNAAQRAVYAELFHRYKKINHELSACKERRAQWQKESDYKQFLLDELNDASFKEDEIEQAAQQLKQLSHAERIMNALQTAMQLLDEGEQPPVNEIKRTIQLLQTISDLVPEVPALQQRLTAAHAELKDITLELEHLESRIAIDDEVMQTLQERVDLGYKLLKKHGVAETKELLALQLKLETELKATLDLDDAITVLEKESLDVHKKMLNEGEKLSERRQATIPGFTKKINELLALVGMPNARFDVKLQSNEPMALGLDEITFLLDANKSGQFLPVEKAASGGEMSRIMLCIKSLTAQAMQLPTLIFDEVDTGISGEAARQVGRLLRDLSQYHQVICITHQPQVAAKGTRHFYVYKDEDKNSRITTKVRVLHPDERVMAIARMIGGHDPSDAAMQNARELVAG